MSVLSTATKTLALIAATALLVTGCSVKQEGASNASSTSAEKSSSASASAEVPSLDGKTIGIAAKDVVRDFGRLTYEGVQDRVKELGGKVVATQADAQDDKHIANVENLISQGVDAIVVILGDTVTLEPALKKAHDAGIPLFTIDHASPYSVNNIGSDNWQIGSTLARTLAEDIGGEGEVLVFNGFYDVVPCQIRYDEFKLVLKNYPGIKTIEPELQDVYEGTIEHAKNQVTDVLTRLSEDEIDAVWSCWDLPSIGAAQAIDAAGRDVKVYGVDAEPGALDLIADPESSFQFTVAQQPSLFGTTSADNVARYLGGQEDEVPLSTYLEAVFIDKSNVNEKREDLGLVGAE
jgi:ribose transport system substrate-binding protein